MSSRKLMNFGNMDTSMMLAPAMGKNFAFIKKPFQALITQFLAFLILTKKQTSLKLLLKRLNFIFFNDYFLKRGVVQQLPWLKPLYLSIIQFAFSKSSSFSFLIFSGANVLKSCVSYSTSYSSHCFSYA